MSDDPYMGSKTFRAWEIDQARLFPPTVKDFVPEGHLAHLVRDLVRDELDLGRIFAKYEELRGYPPYHPTMMTALLLYALCRGVYSSRRLEQACEERVDFMAVTGMSKPDHSTICKFRSDHRQELAQLFVQVLAMCRDAGIAKLGHVALDGTKIKANASKHAAMSYGHMKKAEPELAAVVEEWLERAHTADESENTEHGPNRGDELPPHVLEKIKKLAKIRAAKAGIEEKARVDAERVAEERASREAETGRAPRGRAPKALSGEPEDKEQANFTDPESRIMKTANGYMQAYTGQAAVDADSQVIVACTLNNEQSDQEQLEPLIDQIEEHLGRRPCEVSADAGYCSESNLEALEARGIRGYVATGRQKHGTTSATGTGPKRGGPRTNAMRARLRRGGFRSRYRFRKQSVEPVFGQIKECRGFRQLLHRGLEKAKAEWIMLCTAHNLLKLVAARQ
jgi:transposase